MILSTTQELRLHVPSNAVDDVTLIQGILDNSEKDFLKDKLGTSLYDALCLRYREKTVPQDFVDSVLDGTHASDPWAALLLNAQRMIANDAMARFAYQQTISVNGMGVNTANSSDYDTASEKLLDKGVQGYRKEAMVSLNNLLLMLETWAEQVNTPMAIADTDTADGATDETADDTGSTETDEHAAIEEIVTLWQESRYYYLHGDLLIPTCSCLQEYIDVYDSRDKFIRLLPDLRFIQDEYVADTVGDELLAELLHSDGTADQKLLRRVRRLMVALLEERTTVLDIDKARRQAAHDEAVSLRQSIAAAVKARTEEAEAAASPAEQESEPSATSGFKNNQPGSRMFVAPMIY